MEQLDEASSGRRVGASDSAGSGVDVVELLDNSAASSSATTGSTPWNRWRIAPLVIGLVLSYLLLMLLPGLRSAEVGQVQPVVSSFENPFAVDWVGLDGSPEAEGLPLVLARRPMMSVERHCIGFARTDWPEGSQQPSVARCIESDVVAELSTDGVMVMHESVAGTDTWYVLLFGADVTDVRIEIDGTNDLDANRIQVGERHAAAALPSDYRSWRVTWRLVDGKRYRCDFGRRPAIATTC